MDLSKITLPVFVLEVHPFFDLATEPSYSFYGADIHV